MANEIPSLESDRMKTANAGCGRPRLSSALAPRPTACPIDKLLTDNPTSFDRRRTMIKRYTGLIACALLFAAIRSPALAGPAEEARKHVDMAQATLSNFLRDPNMSWIQ